METKQRYSLEMNQNKIDDYMQIQLTKKQMPFVRWWWRWWWWRWWRTRKVSNGSIQWIRIKTMSIPCHCRIWCAPGAKHSKYLLITVFSFTFYIALIKLHFASFSHLKLLYAASQQSQSSYKTQNIAGCYIFQDLAVLRRSYCVNKGIGRRMNGISLRHFLI